MLGGPVSLPRRAETPFVDRGEELSALAELAARGFYPVLYLYGPEGCGKTRLLLELAGRLERGGYLVVYVDAMSARSVRGAVLGPPDVVDALAEAARGAGPAGRLAALAVLELGRALARRRVEGRGVVVLVDDVARPLGLDLIEAYAKDLLDLLEELYALGARSALVLATTSEGTSRRLLARHNYVRLRGLWNLGPAATSELLEALGAPLGVRAEVWRLTGGNPRSVVELWRRGWDLSSWLRDVEASVRPLLEGLPRDRLRAAVEDVDSVLDEPWLRDRLMEANLIAPVDRPCLGYTPPVDEELGVGERYAWQVPAYRVAVGRLVGGLG